MAVILGFDTSQGVCSVAISEGVNILASIKYELRSMQAEKLISLIEEALIQAKLTYSDIDYIATTTGPGSFTGIRIGIAAAKGLLLSINALPIAVTNFETIYYRVSEQIKNFDNIIAVINAYRNESYCQVFNNKFEMVTEPCLINNKEIGSIIRGLPRNIVCAGSGLIQVLPYLDLRLIRYLPRFPIPDARTTCRVAFWKINHAKEDTNLEPLYIRKPDAKLPV